MNEQLVEVLAARRQEAGSGARPLGFKKFANRMGIEYTTLFRFFKGTKNLGIEAIRAISDHAVSAGDEELLRALAIYALGIEVPIKLPVDK